MNTSDQQKDSDSRYESADPSARAIWFAAGALIVSVAGVIAGIALMFDFLHRRDLAAQQRSAPYRVTDSVASLRPQFPAPRLQVAPQLDLAELRAREDAELNTYGWANRQAGTVRIPVDRAMDLLVQRGLPVRGDPNAPKPTRTPLDMQQARPLQRVPVNEPK